MEPSISKYRSSAFDPKAYYNERFVNLENGCRNSALRKFALKSCHKLSSLLGDNTGSVLCLGSGPSFYDIISLSKYATSIFMSDVAPQNIAEIEKWMLKDPTSLDHKEVLEFVAKLENTSPGHLEERVRNRSKGLAIADVLGKPILSSYNDQSFPEKFDTIVSSYVLEAACKTVDEHSKAVENIAHLLHHGGHLVLLCAPSQTESYLVGNERFSSLKTDDSVTEENLVKNGFLVKEHLVEDDTYGPCGAKFTAFLCQLK